MPGDASRGTRPIPYAAGVGCATIDPVRVAGSSYRDAMLSGKGNEQHCIHLGSTHLPEFSSGEIFAYVAATDVPDGSITKKELFRTFAPDLYDLMFLGDFSPSDANANIDEDLHYVATPGLFWEKDLLRGAIKYSMSLLYAHADIAVVYPDTAVNSCRITENELRNAIETSTVQLDEIRWEPYATPAHGGLETAVHNGQLYARMHARAGKKCKAGIDHFAVIGASDEIPHYGILAGSLEMTKYADRFGSAVMTGSSGKKRVTVCQVNVRRALIADYYFWWSTRLLQFGTGPEDLDVARLSFKLGLSQLMRLAWPLHHEYYHVLRCHHGDGNCSSGVQPRYLRAWLRARYGLAPAFDTPQVGTGYQAAFETVMNRYNYVGGTTWVHETTNCGNTELYSTHWNPYEERHCAVLETQLDARFFFAPPLNFVGRIFCDSDQGPGADLGAELDGYEWPVRYTAGHEDEYSSSGGDFRPGFDEDHGSHRWL